MAKMIPSEFDGATASAAERRFFELLKHDPETEIGLCFIRSVWRGAGRSHSVRLISS